MTLKQRTLNLLGGAAIASVSVLLLASCGGAPATTSDESSDPQPSVSASASGSGGAADLDYPMFYDESMLGQWADARDSLTSGLDAFAADCTAQDTNESDDCHAALFDLLRQVNGIKQLWLTFDNSDWDGGTYSGLEALKPTRDATLVASESGSAWSGSCAAAGGNEECVAEAEVFLGDLDTLGTAFAAWKG
jgi:hypothetical protein